MVRVFKISSTQAKKKKNQFIKKLIITNLEVMMMTELVSKNTKIFLLPSIQLKKLKEILSKLSRERKDIFQKVKLLMTKTLISEMKNTNGKDEKQIRNYRRKD